jgi:hypothetical protein
MYGFFKYKGSKENLVIHAKPEEIIALNLNFLEGIRNHTASITLIVSILRFPAFLCTTVVMKFRIFNWCLYIYFVPWFLKL